MEADCIVASAVEPPGSSEMVMLPSNSRKLPRTLVTIR